MGQLYDITPFTLLDFPGETACIAWFAGCNLRCVYCHNPDIALGHGDKEIDELVAFLKKRAGILTGIVFSGGEATYFPGLGHLAQQAKELGYKVKLDTNGTRPDVLAYLIREHLVDYVALDYKCMPDRAEELIGTSRYTKRFYESLALLIEASRKGLGLEIRTTFHADLMDEDELAWIIEDLDKHGFKGTYYIQNVVSYGDKTIGHIPRPERSINLEKIPKPRNFEIAFRNF
jgi:pyruvate formate lyase activating enzyme